MQRTSLLILTTLVLLSAPAFADTLTYDASVTEFDGAIPSDFSAGEFRVKGSQVNAYFSVYNGSGIQLGLKAAPTDSNAPLVSENGTYKAFTGLSDQGYASWRYLGHIEFLDGGTIDDYESLVLKTNVPNHPRDYGGGLPSRTRLYQFDENPVWWDSGINPNDEGDYWFELVLTELGGTVHTLRIDIEVRDSFPEDPSNPIPEPSTFALVACAGLLLFLRRRYATKTA